MPVSTRSVLMLGVAAFTASAIAIGCAKNVVKNVRQAVKNAREAAKAGTKPAGSDG
jgi:hypothetical protein